MLKVLIQFANSLLRRLRDIARHFGLLEFAVGERHEACTRNTKMLKLLWCFRGACTPTIRIGSHAISSLTAGARSAERRWCCQLSPLDFRIRMNVDVFLWRLAPSSNKFSCCSFGISCRRHCAGRHIRAASTSLCMPSLARYQTYRIIISNATQRNRALVRLNPKRNKIECAPMALIYLLRCNMRMASNLKLMMSTEWTTKPQTQTGLLTLASIPA